MAKQVKNNTSSAVRFRRATYSYKSQREGELSLSLSLGYDAEQWADRRGVVPSYGSSVMQAVPMQKSPARCSHAQSALPPGMLCAEDAVLSPVPMQLPAGAPLPLTMGYMSIGTL